MGEREGPGFRKRLHFESARISGQHEKLNQLHAALQHALVRRARHSAAVAFVRFRDALEAHFEVEDRLYFPAVHGSHPHERSLLDELSRDHDVFLRTLVELDHLLGIDELDEAAEQLTELAAKLTQHEQKEDALLARIAPREPGAAPSSAA